MVHHRDDVVRRALHVLDTWGLGDLTMRRLAGELGVRPSALYHHVPDKQTLLGLVADEILARGRAVASGIGEEQSWDDEVAARCLALHDAVLAYRDGAEVVATARSFGLGGLGAERGIEAALRRSGLPDDLVSTAGRTLVHLVLAHAGDEQTHLQADSAGALPARPGPYAPRGGSGSGSDLDAALGLVLDGIRARVAAAGRA